MAVGEQVWGAGMIDRRGRDDKGVIPRECECTELANWRQAPPQAAKRMGDKTRPALAPRARLSARTPTTYSAPLDWQGDARRLETPDSGRGDCLTPVQVASSGQEGDQGN
ncbi:hypothetical protein RRG08_032912 [Elysia crispata]|uniref:Uncharacterized protein n=1 Tax=Elysia crispata TaxID=231223 RepID=A0AAE1DTV8_9GAST|nr:hypothetical protein RRG08_032912 [Elysia crispata]